MEPVPETEEQKKFLGILDAWRAVAPAKSTEYLPSEEFCEAMLSVLVVLDAFGTAFKVIKLDIYSKVGGIRKACQKTNTTTLQEMVLAELSKKKGGGLGVDSLLWMKRTIQFIYLMLKLLVLGQELSTCVGVAYDNTLKDAHPYVVKKIVENVRYAVPARDVFLSRLYPTKEVVLMKIEEMTEILKPRVDILVRFYDSEGLDTISFRTTTLLDQIAKVSADVELAKKEEKESKEGGKLERKATHRRTKTTFN